MNARLKQCTAIPAFLLAVFLVGIIDQATKDALKVGHLLRTIAAAPSVNDGTTRSAEVSESELNAYIAYRLGQEKASVVKRLTVDLLENNHIQGKISFDAQALKLDQLLGDNLDFDFKGIVFTRNGAARLALIALELCGQPVKPQVFDFVIHTASLIAHQESNSIDDWYELPKGIKEILIGRAKAVVYY